ncbi:MAG TPA: S1 RNA-binding domain-containing protein [Anaerolineae bacterium]|nr:S1 RNA-binding domain-containing protein [Anaerolineae bacterium]
MVQNDAKLPTSDNTEDNKKENITNMASLLEKEGLGIDLPKAGEIRTGTIASISPGRIMVSIGAKSEGIIGGHEFELIPPEEFAAIEVGQELPVYVITPEDQHGNLLLSYVRAQEETSWKNAETYLKTKESYKGEIVGYNKGGLLVSFEKLRGFVPASQTSFARVKETSGSNSEERWKGMVGQEIEVCVVEVDCERHRLILSERIALGETRDTIRNKVLDALQVGDVLTGKVTSLADFGAFVNIDGADGLIHLSEMSWDRILHPGDILKTGQEVQVKVISIDKEKKRIGLSLRALQEDPWVERIKGLRVGKLVDATITKLTKFGAFAKIREDLEGLVHISEISDVRIEHPKEVLHEGDPVTLRIIKIEPESHRIGLSLRRVDSAAYKDLDMKLLQKELENIDIKVTANEEEVEDKEKSEEEQASPVKEDKKPDKAPESPETPSEEKKVTDTGKKPAEKQSSADKDKEKPDKAPESSETPSEDKKVTDTEKKSAEKPSSVDKDKEKPDKAPKSPETHSKENNTSEIEEKLSEEKTDS